MLSPALIDTLLLVFFLVLRPIKVYQPGDPL